ncbi:MAG: diadenylate cyclase [Myxococcota bacterium]
MGAAFSALRFVDLLDIAIVACLLWVLIAWVREARARIALGGVFAIALLFWLARWLDLRLTTSLLQGFIAVAALVLVVVFQDDLRRLFERITVLVMRHSTPRPSADFLDELAGLAFSLAHRRIGALFVLPGREPLDRLLEGGFFLDGRVSDPLLRSLVDPGTPGHDGAIVLRGGKVVRFGVHLPLSTEWSELGGTGTRHAAALGLAERSDALCIVVSEERGEVRVAWRARLERMPSVEALRGRLDAFLLRSSARRRESAFAHVAALARERWREGIVASVLATAFWLYASPGEGLGRGSKIVPVVVDNLPVGYGVALIDPPAIEVEFEGRARDLMMAPTGEFQIRVDADRVVPGSTSVAIREGEVEHPPELRIVGIDPPRIRLELRPL